MYTRSIFLILEQFDGQFKEFRNREPEFILFALSALFALHIEKLLKSLQMKLINLLFESNLNKNTETVLQEFYSYLPKNKIRYLTASWIKSEFNI